MASIETLSAQLVVVVYALMNLASLLAFLADKKAAARGGGRTSERTLLVLALIGPLGAVAGMRLFHHKTRKAKFLLVYAFLLLHGLALAYLFVPGFRSMLGA